MTQYELFDPEELMSPVQELPPATVEELEKVFTEKEEPRAAPAYSPPQNAEIMRFTMMHQSGEIGVIVINENVYDTTLSYYAFPMENVLAGCVLAPETACAGGRVTEDDCRFLNEVWEYDLQKLRSYIYSALNATYIPICQPCAKTFTPEA